VFKLKIIPAHAVVKLKLQAVLTVLGPLITPTPLVLVLVMAVKRGAKMSIEKPAIVSLAVFTPVSPLPVAAVP
jgi:hypothetical protein